MATLVSYFIFDYKAMKTQKQWSILWDQLLRQPFFRKGYLFLKYYQADTSHSTKGIWLGLSIAHRIVELCGGTITVTGSMGNGSTFTVNLPAADQS